MRLSGPLVSLGFGFLFCFFGLFTPAVSGQSPQEPTPAPAKSLLVTKTCAIAYVSARDRLRNFWPSALTTAPNGLTTIYGICDGSFGESELLIPGEFRVFMHVIGPTEEYDVTCLGHLTWPGKGGWVVHFQFDKTCVIPNGKHGYWLTEHGLSGPESPGAKPALPELGYIIPDHWDGNKLTLRFQRDYHDNEGIAIEYSVLHKMEAQSRLIAPGEATPGPYVCPNGEVTVVGKRMCRPEAAPSH